MENFERYLKLSELEARYHSRSGDLKVLASAWVLASLGVAGFLFNSYDYDTWPLPLGFLLVVVMTLGIFGIATLWVLDQFVFHRLLNAVFLAGMEIEKDDPDIPPIRSMMLKTQKGSGVHRWGRYFYLAPVLVYTLISGVVLADGADRLFSPNADLFSLSTYHLSIFLGLLQLSAVIGIMAVRPSNPLQAGASFLTAAEESAGSKIAKNEQAGKPKIGYFAKMKGTTKGPPRVGISYIAWSWIGAFIGIAAVAYTNYNIIEETDLVMVIGSFGATAVLLYGAIKSPLAQPRNCLGGHLVSAIVGVTCYKLFPDQMWLASSLAVATAIAAMHWTKTLHPPGGATALIAVIGSSKIHNLGYLYAVIPAGLGAVIMLVVALLVNNIPQNRRYPEFWI